MSRRSVLALLVLALAVRVLFVAWAPVAPTGDATFYHMHAKFLLSGAGYVNTDGSPGIWWVPGWPAVMAGLYGAFGTQPEAVAWANALFSAVTVLLMASLATRFFGARVGVATGAVLAVWPGLVYYTGTLYSESFFLMLLAATLRVLVAAADADRRRPLGFALAGGLFGLCALVKAEPLALAPGLLLFTAVTRRSAGDFARNAAVLGLATACVLAPWVARNYATFGRFIPTSASGGLMVHLGHHEGSRGGNDFRASRAYHQKHRQATYAETCLAQNDAGWRDAWQFVRENPAEELAIQRNKLGLSYAGDSEGARLLRGFGGKQRFEAPVLWVLVRVADSYWFAVLALAAVGLTTWRRWPLGARVLLPGVLVTWFALHVVFVGGSRYRAPESLAFACLAGLGAERIRLATGSRRPPSAA